MDMETWVHCVNEYYISDLGTDFGSRLRENEEAYRRYKIRPRILVNVDHVDTSTEIFGIKASNKCY